MNNTSQHNLSRASESLRQSHMSRNRRSRAAYLAPAIGLEPITCRLTERLSRAWEHRPCEVHQPRHLHKGLSGAYTGILAVVSPCAGECRFVRVVPVLIFPAGGLVLVLCCRGSPGSHRYRRPAQRARRTSSCASASTICWPTRPRRPPGSFSGPPVSPGGAYPADTGGITGSSPESGPATPLTRPDAGWLGRLTAS